MTKQEAKQEQKKMKLEKKMTKPDGELVFKVARTTSGMSCRRRRFGTACV